MTTLKPTQADREVAARFISETDGDFAELAALFTAHRLATINAAIEIAKKNVEQAKVYRGLA